MSARLAALLHQRALMQEHLAWLEAEIAAAGPATASGSSGEVSSPASPLASPTSAVVAAALKARAAGVTATAPAAPVSPLVSAVAESILDEYRVPPEAVRTDVRKGCFLYFAVGLILFAGAVAGLYFALRHR